MEIKCLTYPAEECDLDSAGDWTPGSPIVIPNLENRTEIRLRYRCEWKSFPNVLFETYPCLKGVEIKCHIESLSPDDLQYAKDLIRLNLQENSISRVRSNTFVHLAKATTLSLDLNGINELEENAFNGMAELKYLGLSYNSLTSLKRNTFAGAPKLQMIFLYENELTSIEEGTFDLPELETLNLWTNKLSTLPNNLFQNAGKLTFLKMLSNKFEEIPPAVFSTSITEFNLDGNPLTGFKIADLAKINNLQTVSLWNTEMTLPATADKTIDAHDSKLTRIDLGGKNLTDNVLEHLSVFGRLERIKLTSNSIVVSRINGILDVESKFPNIDKLELIGKQLECDWLKTSLPSLSVEEGSSWAMDKHKCSVSSFS